MLLTSARVRRALGAVCVALVLGATAACGEATDSDAKESPAKERPSTKESPSSSPATSPAAGKEGLEKLIVTKVKGFEVTVAAAGEVRSSGAVTASKAACQPIADLVGTVAAGSPSDTVYRQLVAASEPEDMTASGVLVGLSSYPRAGAAQALAEVGKAVSACGGGFTTTSADGEDTYSGVTAEDGPTGLDESLAFELTGSLDGEKIPLKYALVRAGDTVALFYAMNPFDPASADIAPTVTAAQIARLK
ncbi:MULTISPECIES: hypothetical protein [unclassified Streptomyces]|uniref:hypothetical protein n=1 Tax=unclassified Streptomyces TaxID=2593676 RepID=UPI0037FFA0D3